MLWSNLGVPDVERKSNRPGGRKCLLGARVTPPVTRATPAPSIAKKPLMHTAFPAISAPLLTWAYSDHKKIGQIEHGIDRTPVR
ncbi:hypothetical protein GCM10010116_07910 [Microbispora rosea subsp. aerata]|nr:hypothetical protein GCM10010116_07910 [Microbispora rosea subsp. aerata]GIH54923.1 hypothetical protein Mro02_18370 [Microbispora rosea subsp. aerata]GLJ82937.1 hypothetical protein GCM10017588_16630 [Microbispora rosea subsp. aerata]